MSLDKKYPDLGSTQFQINKVLKTSTLKSGFKKLQIQMPDSLDTCGWKQYPERGSCGLKKQITLSFYPASFSKTGAKNIFKN